MEMLDRAIEGKYWIVYYLVYVVVIAVGLTLCWTEVTGADTAKIERIFLLAAIFGIAAGSALLSVIIVEVTGRMVLLIPDAWRKLKATSRAEGHAEGLAAGLSEGRAEGLSEGRAEGLSEGHAAGLSEGKAAGRAAEKNRIQDVIAQFGQIDPDTGAITLDPNAQEHLFNGTGKP